MNIARFAGDNKIMQKMAADMAANEALMRRNQSEAMQNAYLARSRDIAATGISNAGAFF